MRTPMDDDPQPRNYTPVPDDLVSKYGLIVAAVFGRMWRYAQMDSGMCMASDQRIADDLDLGRMTVRRAKHKLIQAGLIIDNTPGVRNRPHEYSVKWCTTVVHQTEVGVPERDSSYTAVVQQNDESSTTVVQEESIKESIKKDTIRKKTNTQAKPNGDPRVKALVSGFQDLIGYEIPNWKQESKAAKEIFDMKQEYTPEDVFACWRFMQTEPFWHGKHCGLMSVKKRLGPWASAGKPSVSGNGKNGNSPPREDTTKYQPVPVPAEGSIWGDER